MSTEKKSRDEKGRSKPAPSVRPKRDHRTRRPTARAYARFRQVWLGEGPRVRDPGSLKLCRLREESILRMGEAWHLFISENGIEGFFSDPPEDDLPEGRVKAEQLALGLAWFSLSATPGFDMPETMRETIPYLRREHHRLTAEGPTISQEINRHARQRAYHARRQELARGRKDGRLNAQLREWLMSTVARAHGATDTPDIGEQVSAALVVETWLDRLPPAERKAIERILNDEPTNGDADRQARSRARRRLRKLIEAEQDATG